MMMRGPLAGDLMHDVWPRSGVRAGPDWEWCHVPPNTEGEIGGPRAMSESRP